MANALLLHYAVRRGITQGKITREAIALSITPLLPRTGFHQKAKLRCSILTIIVAMAHRIFFMSARMYLPFPFMLTRILNTHTSSVLQMNAAKVEALAFNITFRSPLGQMTRLTLLHLSAH